MVSYWAVQLTNCYRHFVHLLEERLRVSLTPNICKLFLLEKTFLNFHHLRNKLSLLIHLDVVLHLQLQQPSIVVSEVLLKVKDLLNLAADFFLTDVGLLYVLQEASQSLLTTLAEKWNQAEDFESLRTQVILDEVHQLSVHLRKSVDLRELAIFYHLCRISQ